MPLKTVVETEEFMRRATAIGMRDAEREALVNLLANDPEVGVALGGGLRKMRVARPSGGKSGGYRVLYFFRSESLPVFLLSVFAKNEQANISPKEKAALIGLCDRIASAYGAK
jgi:hypothetical protein